MSTTRKLIKAGCFMALLAYPAQEALSASYWQYDGTAHSQTIWKDGSISGPDQDNYYSLVAPADAFVAAGFANATALSNVDALSAESFTVVKITGSEGAATAGARANNALYGLDAGHYIVSFDYIVGTQSPGPFVQTDAEVGFEMPSVYWSYSEEGSGHYESQVFLDDWINFYAFSASQSSVDGTASTSAKIFNLSVTAVPEPESVWMFACGIALISMSALKSRSSNK